jgi:hypothetical protein
MGVWGKGAAIESPLLCSANWTHHCGNKISLEKSATGRLGFLNVCAACDDSTLVSQKTKAPVARRFLFGYFAPCIRSNSRASLMIGP